MAIFFDLPFLPQLIDDDVGHLLADADQIRADERVGLDGALHVDLDDVDALRVGLLEKPRQRLQVGILGDDDVRLLRDQLVSACAIASVLQFGSWLMNFMP